MTISEGVQVAHEDAVNKGFYVCSRCNGTGEHIVYNDMTIFCQECKGTGIGKRNVGEALMLIVSEIGEAMEAHRQGHVVDPYIDISQTMDAEYFEHRVKDTVEDELADAVIRIFDLCGHLSIDLENHILRKLEYNRGRPARHGKKY